MLNINSKFSRNHDKIARVSFADCYGGGARMIELYFPSRSFLEVCLTSGTLSPDAAGLRKPELTLLYSLIG